MLTMMMLCLSFSLSAQAASGKSKAIKAYKKMLSASTMSWGSQGTKISTSDVKFTLAYINKDSIPELIVYAGANSHVAGAYAVYTWNKGRAVLLANCRDGIAYYKKTGIFTTYTLLQGEYEIYYKISKAKAVQQLSSYVGYVTSYKQGVEERSITESTYKEIARSITKGKRAAKIKWRSNTGANRKKYLK